MSLLDDVGGAFAGLGDLAAAATLTRVTPGAYVPSTGLNATGTTTTSTCKAVLDGERLGYIFDATLVQSGDLMAMIPAKGLTFNPLPGDTITVAGSTFAVIQVKPTFAGSVPVVFNMLVRK